MYNSEKQTLKNQKILICLSSCYDCVIEVFILYTF